MPELSSNIAPLVEFDDFKKWILYEDSDLLVLDKPGWLVCHPSKNGPWSSLVGSAKEYLKVDSIHLASRLDRETSGVVLLAKHRKAASHWQKGIEQKRVRRGYLAVLNGKVDNLNHIQGFIGKDPQSEVFVKQCVSEKTRKSKFAETKFYPVFSSDSYTLCLILTMTGRKHQIRVHSQHMGHPIVGDKLYGPDEYFYLEFCEKGWNPEWDKVLKMRRQALHGGWLCDLETMRVFTSPIPEDMSYFLGENLGLDIDEINELYLNGGKLFNSEITAI